MWDGQRNLRVILSRIYNRQSLAGVDLRNLYLSCMDFSDLDLRGANFDGCRLSFGIMDRSDLSNANLSNTNLTNVSFKRANLSGTIFYGSIVMGANFSGARGLSAEAKAYLESKGATGLEWKESISTTMPRQK